MHNNSMNEFLPKSGKLDIGHEYTDRDDEIVNEALDLLRIHFEFSAPDLAGISMILTPDKMPHEAVINRIASDWEGTSTEDCERKAFLFNAEEMFLPDGYPESSHAEPYSTLRRAARTLRQQHRERYNLCDGQPNNSVNGSLMIIDIPHPAAYGVEIPPAELREFFVQCSYDTLGGNLQGAQTQGHDTVSVVIVAPSAFSAVAAEDESLWYCLSHYGGTEVRPTEYLRTRSITVPLSSAPYPSRYTAGRQ